MQTHPLSMTDEQLWGSRPLLWALRIIREKGYGSIRSLRAQGTMDVSSFLGAQLSSYQASKEEVAQFESALVQRWQQLRDLPSDNSSVLQTNLEYLRDALGLKRTDLEIIAFGALTRLTPELGTIAEPYLRRCCDFVFHRYLARVLDVPASEVTAALDPRGRLIQSGLVMVEAGEWEVDGRLRLLNGLTSKLVIPAHSAEELLESLLPATRVSRLSLADYPHLSAELNLLHARLGATCRDVGINVLLHGAPGSGKTELAAALAAQLCSPLYEVSGFSEEDQTSLTPRCRLTGIIQIQRLVRAAGKGIVLVDEAENFFPTFGSDSEKIPTKSAVNECLERNPTPTIWISNHTSHMEEAFLRRFDLVIRVPPLPSSAKRALLHKLLPAQTLNEQEISRYAEEPRLTQAMLIRLAKVASIDCDDSVSVRNNLYLLSSHYLRTLGAQPLQMSTSAPLLEHDPALLNTDPPLHSVIKTISKTHGARLLLHGPPGTGKTALGRSIAEYLDKTLLRKQASSLLSMWVGETEHNLREMFDEAHRESGVLLLDEADGFLRSRDNARARWEVTLTNELLTQMEDFEGFFICTTNRLDDLDLAALRRFDLKIKFKPLRMDQRILLVRRCCEMLGIACENEMESMAIVEPLRQLDNLTPGDAATALRRLRISGCEPTLAALLAALADECRYKPSAHQPIGFLH